ncbi:Hypothetical protein NTJ_13417 [Nesidiocoris tenuis]|uniref:Uncharacterized protein n=1 Tax=Nesidiocoris tenuis TaxID=355587 RepID=A0ABN7B8A1_9HEMI|nr:Hypothetical protein NTJ_13417 [Nesidiocoris tenuis]
MSRDGQRRGGKSKGSGTGPGGCAAVRKLLSDRAKGEQKASGERGMQIGGGPRIRSRNSRAMEKENGRKGGERARALSTVHSISNDHAIASFLTSSEIHLQGPTADRSPPARLPPISISALSLTHVRAFHLPSRSRLSLGHLCAQGYSEGKSDESGSEWEVGKD